MSYFSALFLIFAFLFTLFILYNVYRYYQKQQLLTRLETIPFPQQWRRYLEHTVHYPKLGDADKNAIERSMLRFIYTKHFQGVGLEVTDEMKVVTAFYACLIVLAKPGYCYPQLETVLFYTHDFIVKEVQSHGGIFTEGTFMLEGQTDAKTVVLSWHEARKQAYHLTHHNVIVHEFAHELDFEDGIPDGIPPLQRGLYANWAKTLHHDFDTLSQAVTRGRYLGKYKLLGEYAATNEAEFFAVASELYFERPEQLKKHFPELYNLLKEFYEQASISDDKTVF
jgi:Mlc titration factor MtfA (ptsG expression regulator)